MSASDILHAAGAAAQEKKSDFLFRGTDAKEIEAAFLLCSIAYQGKSGDMHRLVDLMASKLMCSRHPPKYLTKATEIARACLAWWLSQCETCGGVGYELIPHTIARKDDEVCSACHGTGKLPMLGDSGFLWLASELDRLQSLACGKIMQKLAGDMDL
jgi:hypothetical protein